MRANRLLAFGILCCACGLLPGTAQPEAAAPAGAQPLQEDEEFPRSEADLKGLVDKGDVPAMRKHAWLLFARITTPSKADPKKPVWATWHTVDDTFPAAAGPKAAVHLNTPNQFGKAPGIIRKDLPSGLLTVNSYNDDAHRYIIGRQLYLKKTLDDLAKNGQALNFPRRSVVVKTVWWIVKKDATKDDPNPLPVWDEKVRRPDRKYGFQAWDRVVGVYPADDDPADVPKKDIRFYNSDFKVEGKPTARQEFVPRTGCRVVSLKRLFHFPITDEQAKAVPEGVRKEYKRFYNGRDIQAGDYAALIGFHFTTKEIPEWVWATLWWHDNPDSTSEFAKGRPDDKVLPRPWRNYLMNVAYSMDLPSEGGDAKLPHSCYNPYLEAVFTRGIRSNCMTCHRRAVWPDASFVPVTEGSPKSDDPDLKGKLRLDFLWSLYNESRD